MKLRGTLWTDYVDPSQLADTGFIRPELDGGRPHVLERRVLRPDGSVTELEIHARQFTQGRMLGTARDVGARKAAERERARLIQAIEQSAESIIITDPAGTIVYVNPALEKESGFTREEVLGQNHASSTWRELPRTSTPHSSTPSPETGSGRARCRASPRPGYRPRGSPAVGGP